MAYVYTQVWKCSGSILCAGAGDEPVGAGVPGAGEPRGAVPGRHQLQLRGARQALPAHVQPLRRREDRRRARAALRHTQVGHRDCALRAPPNFPESV